jgi:hypothetical protein
MQHMVVHCTGYQPPPPAAIAAPLIHAVSVCLWCCRWARGCTSTTRTTKKMPSTEGHGRVRGDLWWPSLAPDRRETQSCKCIGHQCGQRWLAHAPGLQASNAQHMCECASVLGCCGRGCAALCGAVGLVRLYSCDIISPSMLHADEALLVQGMCLQWPASAGFPTRAALQLEGEALPCTAWLRAGWSSSVWGAGSPDSRVAVADNRC